MDSLSDETKMETKRDINTRAFDEIATVNGRQQVFYLNCSIPEHHIIVQTLQLFQTYQYVV